MQPWEESLRMSSEHGKMLNGVYKSIISTVKGTWKTYPVVQKVNYKGLPLTAELISLLGLVYLFHLTPPFSGTLEITSLTHDCCHLDLSHLSGVQ